MILQLNVLAERIVEPEAHELNLLVGESQAVDTTKALDDTHRIPVDVVVDQTVSVLQVLSLGNAVGD